MNVSLTKTISKIVHDLQAAQHNVWLVGGAIRDLLMKKTPKDLDLCTNCDPNLVRLLMQTAGLICIPDKKAMDHGIIRVVDQDTGEFIDIATLRKDVTCDGRHAEVAFTTNIEEDLARRDLTINAIAAPIFPDGRLGELIDPFGGKQRLTENAKRIEFVGIAADRIKEDALRMVRACRFTALGEDFFLDPQDLFTIKEHASLLKMVSKERIRDEIMKALSYDKPSNFFRALEMTDLLKEIFPEMQDGVGCVQNVHHDSDPVFDHILRCLDASVHLTDKPLLRLAVLTHDIGKPATKAVKEDGSITFYKHEVVGASIVYNWMKKMKFSNADTEYVSKLVRHHQWRFEDDTKDKTIRKWLQEVGKDLWEDLITLRCADRKGNKHKMALGKGMITSKMRELMDKVRHLIDSGVPLFKEDLAINGNDLQDLGVKPGPVYKEIFSNLLGIVVNDPKKNTKEWLSDYVRRHYAKEESKQN